MRTKTVEYSNKKSKYLSGFLILHWFFKYLFCLVRTEISGRRRVHFAGIQDNSNTLVTKSYQNSSKIDWRGVLLYVPPSIFGTFLEGTGTWFCRIPAPTSGWISEAIHRKFSSRNLLGHATCAKRLRDHPQWAAKLAHVQWAADCEAARDNSQLPTLNMPKTSKVDFFFLKGKEPLYH